jgi:hypothetical protein
MTTRRVLGIVLLVAAGPWTGGRSASGQCCLTDMFAGCGSCFRKAPVYAVAPMAPVAAPVVAPVPAPPPPVMVPVQQVSYVPETTYRTQYQSVPVTTYKPSCEIDPCTGCPRDCMQPVTQYVQQAVNVPVTQYRAVTTTKYVQMQPGYAGGSYPAAAPLPYGAPAAAVPAPPAASAFAAPVQAQPAPTGWGAAGADVPPQPGMGQPTLPPGTAVPNPMFQQQITPQGGTYAPIQAQSPIQMQPTMPPALTPTPPLSATPVPSQAPALSPTPSLKPIPEMPKTGAANGSGTVVPKGAGGDVTLPGNATPAQPPAAAPPSLQGMPVLPGEGPKASTRAFPRLLEPTGHTTSWQPASTTPWAAPRSAYPTAALPSRLQQ